MRLARIRQVAIWAALFVALAGAMAGAQTLFYRLGPAQPPGDGPRWDYLVVASRVEFSLSTRDVTMQPLSEHSIELPFVYEARLLEGRLNELGEAGWELVAVVGTVGGDQEFIFKRPRR